MALTNGTRLGPYEIVAPIGAGGMGEVYRAHDTRLERNVAIKVLPASYSADPDRLRRFEQEARAASQLNHPNIVVVHDFGTNDSAPYVVQELLEGETLRERLKSGPLGTRKTTEYALEIARGLAAAHDKGIAHRDLKPENIFITTDGRVKILDFGLAKLIASEPQAGTLSATRTATIATRPGIVMGTVGYMSPEQVRAQPTDARTDIFSLGAILFEMLTGRRAFQRETSAETMTAILNEEPPEISTLAAGVPPSLERVVNHCLEKSPEQRFQSAKDLAFALSALSGSGTSPGLPATGKIRRRGWLPWAALAAMVIAGTSAAYLFVDRPAPAERMQFAIPVQSEVRDLALSADGRMLALSERDDASGENMLYYMRLGAAGATRLDGTENASYPFWSPDDKNIGFFANGQMQRVSVSGGPPQVITSAPHGRGGSWGSQGIIIYAPDTGGPLWRVGADGSGAAPLTEKSFLAGEASHRWPEFLPDGNHFLFLSSDFASKAPGVVDGIYSSSLSSQDKKLVFPEDSNFSYANGHLYFEDDHNDLAVIPFSVRQEKALGNPEIIAEHLIFQSSVYHGMLTAGGSNTVVYSTNAGADTSALTWVDASGKDLQRVGGTASESNPSISPDGNRALVDIADPKSNTVNVWIEDLAHGTASRFTFDLVEDATAVWSRDGRTIAYRTNGYMGAGSIMVKPASGLGAEREIYRTKAQDDILPNSWSPDDKFVLCTLEPVAGGSSLLLVDVVTGKSTPFIANKASVTNGIISPDGKWVAYASNETGTWEIYVSTYPAGQGKWQVSRGGGTEPRWRADAKEIYYVDPKGTLTAVAINTQGTFSAGIPTPLFALHGRRQISNTDLFSYDVSKDGKRFLVNRDVKPDHVDPLTVVLNATVGSKE
jgi:eukaryotic-like serine/threonine-protein kinase